MRVLVVEDDRSLGQYLKKGLELEGHCVSLAVDGEDALRAVMSEPPELLMLDLNLPKKDGIEVLEVVHRMYASISVMVLTGRSQVEERVRCLNLGADDCLVKPFSFHELSARCRALGRRRVQQADPVLRCGALSVNRMERSVECAGHPVELTAKEFSLLEFLLRHRGHCVSRGTLLEQVWRMSPDAGTNVVDVYINYLRKKLANGTSTAQADHGQTVSSAMARGADDWIETVRGSGYRLRDGAASRATMGGGASAALGDGGDSAARRKPAASVGVLANESGLGLRMLSA